MSKKKKIDDSDSQPSFELALEQLQAIVRELESGQLTLDQSLAKYEQGVANLRVCYDLLQRAEQKIRMMVQVDEQGQIRTQPFAHSATGGESLGEHKRKAPQSAVRTDQDNDKEDSDDSDNDFEGDDDTPASEHRQKLF